MIEIYKIISVRNFPIIEVSTGDWVLIFNVIPGYRG